MQKSSLKISRINNAAISLRMIRVELVRLCSYKEDVFSTLDALYSLAKRPNLILSKNKAANLYHTQTTLCEVLENLVDRLNGLHEQLSAARNYRSTKNTLLQFSQNFQQLKVEADLFREMHFRVKRNCMKSVRNFPRLVKTKEPIKMAA